ncbi:MAG TPA: SDR family oxidoreductase [Acidimicrobiales bacterium]|nr:SDR family oxidoreductase [Acidimicrobiales bacterium]
MTRRALVTGVGRRAAIGAAIADRLREDGWDVTTVGWRPYDVRMAWGADERPLADHEVDLTDPSAPDALFDVLAAGGPITALVLCHAESVDSDILTTTVESFDRHFAVNARATWLLIRAFARQLPRDAEGGSRIVAMTSDHTAFNLPYGASKGALDRIVLAAATELADLGVTANVVNPGPNDTGWMDDDVKESVLRQNLQPRLGTPSDTANLVSFLLSEQGGWINGQVLHSDGGRRG